MQDFTSELWIARDHELVEGIRSLDARVARPAQQLYVAAYSQPLFGRVRAYALGDANAEDLCQETWLTALRKLRAGQYQSRADRCSLGWLINIGFNKVRTWRRTVFREQ